MQLNLTKELATLRRLTTKELRDRYAELFGEATQANNRAWLLKRIAWRLQAQAEGGLSERARQRAAELANEADLRLNPPKDSRVSGAAGQTCTRLLRDQSDDRLPAPGSILSRVYKGERLEVKVLERGFEFEGLIYRSLSALARHITGSHCNGVAFFCSSRKGGQP